MADYMPQQYVELFHLLFLGQFGRKLDKRFYVLKGGCNLRFYLKSFRYSEGMDLDVQTINKDKLQDIVGAILGSRPFGQILQVHGISIGWCSKPKQTETTQRWKLALAVRGSDVPLHTKIEFSRRGPRKNAVFEAIDPELISKYQLSPIMANHYDAHTAYEQKVEALTARSTVQARDIFDLNLLLAAGVDSHISDRKLMSKLAEAQDNAMSITFDVFKSQVLSFLRLDYQSQYDSESVWDDVVLRVTEALNKERK